MQRLPRFTGFLVNRPSLAKVRDVVAQGPGEGLNKAAAARGTSFVEHNGVHGAVADFEALHILAADVDDKVHVRVEVGGGVVVGYRLHQAQVAAEGVFDQILTVAGDGTAPDDDPVTAELVDVLQLLPDDGHRVAQIGVVVGVKQAAVGSDEGQLGGGGTGVNAQIGVAGVVEMSATGGC